MALPVCYAVCGTAWAACYTSAGLVAGTVVTTAFAPAAALACNDIAGTCMATCHHTTVVGPVALATMAALGGMSVKLYRQICAKL